MAKIYGSTLWKILYGDTLWQHCMAKLCGNTLWQHFMATPSDASIEALSVQYPSVKVVLQSLSLRVQVQSLIYQWHMKGLFCAIPSVQYHHSFSSNRAQHKCLKKG